MKLNGSIHCCISIDPPRAKCIRHVRQQRQITIVSVSDKLLFKCRVDDTDKFHIKYAAKRQNSSYFLSNCFDELYACDVRKIKTDKA